MWSREESTVRNTLSDVRKGRALSSELDLASVDVPLGPWPVGDQLGFQVAIELLRASQRKGWNRSDYTQFDSIRKLRAAYFNAFQTSPEGMKRSLWMKGPKGSTFGLTSSPTDSVLFCMFTLGCEKRMGRVVLQELAFSVEIILALLRDFDAELESEDTEYKRKRDLVVVGATLVVLCTAALRGGEVLLMEASELIRRRLDGKNHEDFPHVVIPLMGRFKNETGERNILFALASVTASGIEVRKWVERLIILLMQEGRNRTLGPAICEADGFVMERWKINGIIREGLMKIQRETDLIPEGISVEAKYSIHRSGRRFGNTRAKQAGVPDWIINLNNRWRKFQAKSGSMPNLPMDELYLEITHALKSRTAFSAAL